MKKAKLAIYFLTALAAISVALAARAQTQTHDPAHGQSQDQSHDQSQTKRDGHDAMSHDGASHDGCPMMQANKSKSADAAASHDEHNTEMNARGERAMGFSQTATTHHFTLAPDGGAIRVEANDAKDTASRAQIREHLAHIAEMFAAGNFDTPMFVHDETPPGVPVMQKLKAVISYRYEETEGGARVVIKTDNAEALAAVHAFLRFQITEHRTGDPLEVVR